MPAPDAESLVVDASTVVQGCLTSHGLDDILAHHVLHVPGLCHAEALSALRGLVWREEISEALCAEARGRLASLKLTVHPSQELATDAWTVADRLGWAKTYDAEYVALAQRLGCSLITIDARLQRAAGSLARILAPSEVGGP